MNLVLSSIYSFFESLGKARAAAALSQAGRQDLAKQLMLGEKPEFEVHP
jgi:hypothetical protein